MRNRFAVCTILAALAATALPHAAVAQQSPAKAEEPADLSPKARLDKLFADLKRERNEKAAERISARAIALTGAQNNRATSDAVATTVAVVVFWPAAFACS